MAAPETEKERSDRQLAELMAELRVAIPGAQVLLGFLLTVPFATRFGRTTRLERLTLFACLLLTVAGTVLLMAPSVYHRLRWGQGEGKADKLLTKLAAGGFLSSGINRLAAARSGAEQDGPQLEAQASDQPERDSSAVG